MNCQLKRIFILSVLVSFLCFLGSHSEAQIALSYSDTSICPGNTIEMCAALTGHASSLNSDDQYSEVVSIGFPFKFFGTTYTKLVASGNAFINFDTANAYPVGGPWYFGQTGYSTANCVFAAFADWYLPNGGQIRYESYGVPGHKKFIIEWCSIPAFIGGSCDTQKVITQMILYEGTNIIEVHTTHLPALSGGCPTASPNVRVVQGVEDPTGALSYYTTDRDPLGALASNWGTTGIDSDAVRITPLGGSPFSYKIQSIPFAPVVIIDSSNSDHLSWYEPNQPNIPIHVGACATVTPDGSQHYYLVKYNGIAGCENLLAHLVDTVHIHYGVKYDTTNVTICQGETYNFLGKALYQSGQYDTLFIAASGCDSFVTLNLTVNPLPDVAMKEKSALDICQGDSVRIAILDPEGTTNYQWIKDGYPISGANQPSLFINSAGTYVLKATTNKGCTASTNPITVAAHDRPVVKIAPLSNAEICAYDTLQLSVENSDPGNSYVWEPSKPFQTIAGNETPVVSGVFLMPTEVILTAFNKFGCSNEDSVFVITKPCCEVFIPNAFTPNGDGKNDYFKPELENGQILTSMRIYNRLGQLVYDNKNVRMGWDGTFDGGKVAPSDIYMYLIEYTCADGKLYQKKGNIGLLR